MKMLYCFILISFGNCILAQENKIALEQSIYKILKYELYYKANNTPSFVCGIIDKDSSFVLSMGTSPTLTDSTVFELAGLSKIFTALAVEHLIQEDHIHRNTPIMQVIPELSSKYSDVTIASLLTHTSGIPRQLNHNFILSDKGKNHDITLPTFIKKLNKTRRKRNNSFKYSHLNYVLLQVIIERITKQSLQVFLETYFSKLTKHDIKLNRNAIPGTSKGGIISDVQPNNNIYWGSMGMTGSLNDIMILVRKVLLPHLTHHALPNKNQRIFIERDKLCQQNGWYVFPLKNQQSLYSHSGHNTRHKSVIQIIPESNSAIILLFDTEIGINDLSFYILDLIN